MEEATPYTLEDTTEMHGLEVLTLPSVELTKAQGNLHFFSGIGTLSILYFESYDKFMLKLNDWYYVLMDRIPVRALTKTGNKIRYYAFPSYSGFYIMKIKKIPKIETLENFETILTKNCNFSYQTEGEALYKHVSEQEVDMAISHEPIHGTADTSNHMEPVISPEMAKLHGREKIKEEFHKLTSKLHHKRNKMQKQNPTLGEIKAYKDLKHSGIDTYFLYPIARKNLEAAIIRSRQILEVMNEHEIKTTATSRSHHSTIRPLEQVEESLNSKGNHLFEDTSITSENPLNQATIIEDQSLVSHIMNQSVDARDDDLLKDDDRWAHDEAILSRIRESEQQRANEADALDRFKRQRISAHPEQRNPALFTEGQPIGNAQNAGVQNIGMQVSGLH